MKNPFKKDKKPDPDDEYQRAASLSEISRENQSEQQRADFLYSLGRSIYMIQDPILVNVLLEDDEFKAMYAAFSQLNRTTNIGNLDRELLLLDYEALLLINKLNMDEDKYENLGWAKMEALKIFARYMVSDSFHGWKGRLVTEQIKIIRTELEKKKKGRFF